MEQLDYNLLFRWFVGLELDEPIWTPTVFTKNRDRLLNQEIARSFFRRVVDRATGLMSDEHFTVDGTLIEAWASQKSFQRKDGPPPASGGRNFHGEQRRNETHASTTDPDAKLYRRTRYSEARLAYLGHLVIENRSGLIVEAMATVADGYAERTAAQQMLAALRRRAGPRRRTVGADKGYDTRAFVAGVRAFAITPRHPNAPPGGSSSTRGRPGTRAMRTANTPARVSSPPSGGSRPSRGSGSKTAWARQGRLAVRLHVQPGRWATLRRATESSSPLGRSRSPRLSEYQPPAIAPATTLRPQHRRKRFSTRSAAPPTTTTSRSS